MIIYLDNAASTPMDPEVFEAMKPYFLDHFGNPSSTHAHGRTLRNAIEDSRRTVAKHLGVSPGEICFTSGGTEADNMAIKSSLDAFDIKHVISTRIEHHAVSHTLEHLEEMGKIKVTWLGVDGKGHIDHEELREVLATNSRSLVSLMHANNELGTLHDIHAIGEICREYNAIFHSDTVQSMCNVKYDLANTPVDFVTASAHKFYGPKGVGFLYIRKGLNVPGFISGGGQERNRRAGTENAAFIVGLAHAFNKCYSSFDSKSDKLWDLKNYMKQRLMETFPGVSFNGETEPGKSLPTVLNVSLPCNEKDCMLLFNLDLAGICASGGSACSSGAVMGSFVLREIGVEGAQLLNAIRFSFGVQNTREEIDITIEKLKDYVPMPV
ncbi:MAG: cysteine desulfurase family protein [Bacteroidota bacterium]